MCLVLSLRGEGQRKKGREGKRQCFLEQSKQLFISRCLFVVMNMFVRGHSISLLLLLFYLILSIYHPIESPVPDKNKKKNENKKKKNEDENNNRKPVSCM